MTSDLRSRFVVLFGLAVLATGVVWGGTTLGVGAPIADADPAATFNVTGDGVTLSDGDREVTVVDNFTEGKEVEIEQTDGRFTVRTTQPLTADERERAIDVVRGNETVQNHLDEMDDYEFAVEPIRKVEASESFEIDVNASGNASNVVEVANGSTATFTLEMENASVETDDDSVLVADERSYVEDEAAVEIRRGDGTVAYDVFVDLERGTVVQIIE